jgi:hypothetical protein
MRPRPAPATFLKTSEFALSNLVPPDPRLIQTGPITNDHLQYLCCTTSWRNELPRLDSLSRRGTPARLRIGGCMPPCELRFWTAACARAPGSRPPATWLASTVCRVERSSPRSISSSPKDISKAVWVREPMSAKCCRMNCCRCRGRRPRMRPSNREFARGCEITAVALLHFRTWKTAQAGLFAPTCLRSTCFRLFCGRRSARGGCVGSR